ncbi:hypothetical protein [Nocardia sp. NPDC051750]|uniref:hypothetical protein n=1 Tax=Nocardia sp. NPDC051750 TaxID=3364325 RepID=UPI0037AF5AF1
MTDKPAGPAAEDPMNGAKSVVAPADTSVPEPVGAHSDSTGSAADSVGPAAAEPAVAGAAVSAEDSAAGEPEGEPGPAGVSDGPSSAVAEPSVAAEQTVSVQKHVGERVVGGSDSGPDRRREGSRPRALLAALAVTVLLLVAAVGVAGYLFVQERDKAGLLAAHDEVRQAACRYAPVLANYDAKNLEPYFSAVLAGATGDWKKEFETTTTELREALAAGQVVSTAGDIQCAVKSADPTSAEVVVVIGQTITSLGTQGQPAPGQLAMVMRMQKTDGRWLVDQMTSPLATPLP